MLSSEDQGPIHPLAPTLALPPPSKYLAHILTDLKSAHEAVLLNTFKYLLPLFNDWHTPCDFPFKEVLTMTTFFHT